MTTLIALAALVALLVSSVTSVRTLTIAAQHQRRHSDDQLRVGPNVTHVDRSLAPSLDITPKTPLEIDRRNGDGSSADGVAALIPAHHTLLSSDATDGANAPAIRWVSIERPTRERARLMVFLI
jgi:hypothetical protein